MLAWRVPNLGWTRLPNDLSEFEIAHFFSLLLEQRMALLTRYRESSRGGRVSFVLKLAVSLLWRAIHALEPLMRQAGWRSVQQEIDTYRGS